MAASAPPGVDVVALIEKKKRGGALTPDELTALIVGFLQGTVPDYQLSAWLMAVWFRGMTPEETLALTRTLVDSGHTFDWSDLPGPVVDKHSTGGVGDKTSIVLVPLMAAAGLPFAKMSGRGLGHTGGTLDKLESIPGFSVSLPLDRIGQQVRAIGCALVGQTPELVPADGALYALRDVTGTVDAIPLIASSIMSKKLAGGASVIVLDVKYGSGAFLRSFDHARELARVMVEIGQGAGRRVRAVLSSMEQPLGRAVGNALEVREAIETLRGRGPDDLWQLTLELGSHLAVMAGRSDSPEAARSLLSKLRASGAATAKLEELITAQGGDARVVDDPGLLPAAPHVLPMEAPGDGWVESFDARTVAEAALELGAGRRAKGEPVNPAVGVEVLARVGDRVAAGEEIARIHARSAEAAGRAAQRLSQAVRLSGTEVAAGEAGYQVVGDA
jgi:pyrimidine-nucleoside phosphorylase